MISTHFQFLFGPSRFAPFAGLLVKFDLTEEYRFSRQAIAEVWSRLVGHGYLLWNDYSVDDHVSFAELCAAIVESVYQPSAYKNLDIIAFGYDKEDSKEWILLRYLFPEAARFVLGRSVKLTEGVFKALKYSEFSQDYSKYYDETKNHLASLDPEKSQQTLIRKVVERNIPRYWITNSSWRYIQLGQGVHSRIVAYTNTDGDSGLGTALCHDKALSNELVSRFGYPGVVHAEVNGFEDATKVAKKLGFPLVVKPKLGSMGIGITANIKNLDELRLAVRKARQNSDRGVIVERFIDGIDHRITVMCGKITWVSAKYPAQVTGDGKHTIDELIDLENLRRAKADDSKKTLQKNRETDELLVRNSMSYSYRPEAGEIIRLSTVANLSKGGTIKDVTDKIHPENSRMAVSLAKAFRMDCLGIDFITNDIGKTWREGSCGIIELNQTPGFSASWQAARYIDSLFPPQKGEPRIMTVLLVDCADDLRDKVATILTSKGFATASVQENETNFDGYIRGHLQDGLQTRIFSVLSDPECEALVIHTDERQIMLHGLPLDKLDLAVIPYQASEDVCELLNPHCQYVENVDLEMSAVLDKLITLRSRDKA